MHCAAFLPIKRVTHFAYIRYSQSKFMQRSIFAITHLESKSTSRRRDDSCRVPDLRRYLQVSIYPAISIARTLKKQAAWKWMRMKEGEEMVEEESRRKLQLGWLYTHCMRKCRVQFLKFRRVAFSCHSNAIALVLPPSPLPSLRAASRDLSSVSPSSKPASVLFLLEFIANRHPRCDATWS